MNAAQLTQRLNDMAEYLRQIEQDRIDERADMDDELAALRLRIDALETLVAAMQ